jgi:hypothetical protein
MFHNSQLKLSEKNPANTAPAQDCRRPRTPHPQSPFENDLDPDRRRKHDRSPPKFEPRKRIPADVTANINPIRYHGPRTLQQQSLEDERLRGEPEQNLRQQVRDYFASGPEERAAADRESDRLGVELNSVLKKAERQRVDLNAVLEMAGGGHMREVSGGALVDDLALVGLSAVVESWAGFVRDGLEEEVRWRDGFGRRARGDGSLLVDDEDDEEMGD